MDKILSSDLPPAYCTLALSPEDTAIAAAAASSDNDTEHLISKTFEDKYARIIFTQKVLSIVLLQKIAIGIILGICLHVGADFNSNSLWLVSVMLWWCSLFIMLYADRIKDKKLYNYVILVFYPLAVNFVILTFPVLVYNMYSTAQQWELRKAIVSAWVSYIAAGLAVLFYCIFSLDANHEFRLRHKMLTSTLVFIVSYLCMSIQLFFYNDFDPVKALYVTLFLFLYHLYVLYDIHTMTGSDYRCALTPADYFTGAVNLQIDILFVMKSFIGRLCCDSENDEQ